MQNKKTASTSLKYLTMALFVFVSYFASNRFASGEDAPVIITPVLPYTAPQGGTWGRISFKITNTTAKGVMIVNYVKIEPGNTSGDLMLEEYHAGLLTLGGPQARPTETLLAPLSSQTIEAFYSVHALAFFKAKEIPVFASVKGYTNDPKQSFVAHSPRISLSKELTTLPWVDLGQQNYFSIIPEVNRITVNGNFIMIPVTVKNTSNKSYNVNRIVIFYLESEVPTDMGSFLYETIKDPNALLKPGDSLNTESTGRSYVSGEYLKAGGYAPRDKLIALVIGQVPDTNQVFECTSAPFELPSAQK